MNKKTIGKILLIVGIVATVALIAWGIYEGIDAIRIYNELPDDTKKYLWNSAGDAFWVNFGEKLYFSVLSIATAVVGIVLIKKSK